MKKKTVIKIAAVACLACLLVGSFAFFTDRTEQNSTATAGNINLVFTDASNFDSHKVDETQTNGYTDGKVWEDSKLVAENDIMNPGDMFDMGYTLKNTGNKSIDVKQQLTVLVTDAEGEPMTLTESENPDNELIGDYQYFLTCATEDLGLTLDEEASDIAAGKLVYTLPEIILNGEVEEETDGVAFGSEQDFDLYLTFERLAKNIFMDSNVDITLDVQAKQHRNTTNEDWVDWATYDVAVDGVTPVEEIED